MTMETEAFDSDTPAISLKHFRNPDAIASASAGERVDLGQIVGIVYSIIDYSEMTPGGFVITRPAAVGEFVAQVFAVRDAVEAGGEVYEPLESTKALLPAYFMEQLEFKLTEIPKDAGLEIAMTVYVEPSSGEIAACGVPFQYSVERLPRKDK